MDQLEVQERVRRVRAVADGRWRDVFISVGIDANAVDGKARPCPMCGGRDRFVFDDKFGRGDYFCRHCGAGDGFALIGKFLGCSFFEALKTVERFYGLEVKETKQRSQAPDEQKIETDPQKRSRIEMMELWSQAHPVVKDDAVYKYLSRRGLKPESAAYEIRCHEKLPYRDESGSEKYFPAMLSRVVDQNGCVVNLHRTYLTQDGQKAPVEKVKKVMAGSVTGACVQFGGSVSDVLNLTEGIETALAVLKMTGQPTWATLGCVHMKNLETLPETVKAVNIFADNDANYAGQAAAYALAFRLSNKGIRVKVNVPQQAGYDWLDAAKENAWL